MLLGHTVCVCACVYRHYRSIYLHSCGDCGLQFHRLWYYFMCIPSFVLFQLPIFIYFNYFCCNVALDLHQGYFRKLLSCLTVSLVNHFAPVPGCACLCIHIHFCTKVWAWDASLVFLHAWMPQGIRRFSLQSSLCQLEATSLGKYVHKIAQQGWWLKYDWET